MKCMKVMEKICPKMHKYRWRCYKSTPAVCPTCILNAVDEEKRKAQDLELEAKREAIQREHAKSLSEITKKIEEQQQILKDIVDEKDRRDILAQKARDLEDLKAAACRARRPQPTHPPRIADGKSTSPPSQNSDGAQEDGSGSNEDALISVTSDARDEWERQKRLEGQSNDALDSMMTMIGLEEVKDSLLSIKAKVDTVVRQGASLKDERFGAALLGNPGTGMYSIWSIGSYWIMLPGISVIANTIVKGKLLWRACMQNS